MTDDTVKAYWARWKLLRHNGPLAVACPALVSSRVPGAEPEQCAPANCPCRHRREPGTFHPERVRAHEQAEDDLAQLIAWEQAVRGAPRKAPSNPRARR